MAEMDRRAPARTAVSRVALPISAKTGTDTGADGQCDVAAQPPPFIYSPLVYRGCDGAADVMAAVPFKLYLDCIVLEESEGTSSLAEEAMRSKTTV